MHALSVSLLRAKQLPVITNGLGASPHAGSTCTIGVVTVRPLNRLPARLYFKLKPDPSNTFSFIFTCTTQYPWMLANLNLSQAMAPSKKKRTHTVFRDSSAHRSASTSKPRFIGEKQPLENRVDYVRGVTYKAAVDLHEELNDSSYVLLRANNIQDGELRFDDVQYVDRTKVKQKQLLRRGDILFCASSGSKGLVGKAALVRENMPVTFGAFCCVLRPKENEAEYLAHYFQSQQYRRAIEKVCSGSNINNLKAANFFSLVVPHYDDDSTRIISALFDSIDAQIKHAKDQIANLDSLVKSRFVEMFGDALSIESKWDSSILKNCVESLESGKSPSCKNVSRKGFDPGVLKLSALSSGRFLPGENKAMLDGETVIQAKEVKQGDILVARKNTPQLVGSCVLVREDVTNLMFPDIVFRMHPNDSVNGEYLAALLSGPSYSSKVRSLAHGSNKSMSNIPKSELATLSIPLPPLSLQQEFADFASQVDKSRFVRDHEINFRWERFTLSWSTIA